MGKTKERVSSNSYGFICRFPTNRYVACYGKNEEDRDAIIEFVRAGGCKVICKQIVCSAKKRRDLEDFIKQTNQVGKGLDMKKLEKVLA